MSASVTNIQLTSRDTVNFYVDTEIVRNMSQIVPAASTYIQRIGNDIMIFQPPSAVSVPIPPITRDEKNQLTTNSPFQFSTSTVEQVGAKTYTPLDPLTDDAAAYEERAIDVYNYIVNNIFKGCCDCGTGDDGCSIQWQYDSGLGTGTWYYASGILIFDFTSYLSQDWQDYLAQLPSGSQITLVSEADPSIIVVFEIGSYSAISGYASWSATIINGASSYTESTIWCVSFQPALGGGGGSQGWQDTLIVDPDLTQNNTSNAGNFDFTWTNFKTWLLQATSFLNDVVSAIRLRTTGATSDFLIQHDATANPLRVDVNSSGGTTWNTLGPTRFIGDASNEVDLETTGFGSRRNDLNMKATDSSSTDTPDDRNVINFYNNRDDGNGSRKWFAMRHTDLSTVEVFGLYAYDPSGSGAFDRWVWCSPTGAFSNPYSNNFFIGQFSNPAGSAYPFPTIIEDGLSAGSLVILHNKIDIFNNTRLTSANTYANSPIIRFVTRVWLTGQPAEEFGQVKHAYQLQQQFAADIEDTAWQVGFKDAEIDALPATLRSLFVYYNGDVRLGAYPSSRNDGSTSSALYVDANGYIKYGPISGGGVTPAAMTKTDDTNVTLTLGGTPATSLLQAVSLTLGWTGTLADARIASAATWNAKLSTYRAPFNIDCNSDQVNASSTSYYNIYPGSGIDGTEATRQNIVPIGGNAKGYAIYTLSTQNASGSLVLTLRKNGANTALTITIAAGSASGIFTDNVNSVAITKQSDLLSHQVLNNSTSATAQIKDISFVIESTE
jgi:hypothetical protein